MAHLIDPEVQEYADAHTTAPPGHLASVDASTREDFAAWGMMVGRQEGRFLELLVFATQATSVLEIGTFTGYSAMAMAAGLGKDGAIISLEVDPHHAQVARGNIAAAGLESHISVIEGPALRSLEELQGPFDLVFIDADKVSYDAYFEAVLPKLAAPRADRRRQHAAGRRRPGRRRSDPHEGARALRAFNDKVVNDPRWSACSPPSGTASPDPPGRLTGRDAVRARLPPPPLAPLASTRRRCGWSSWPSTASGPRRRV